MNDTQVYYGGSIKDLGDGRVGGYLVMFGDATKTDLEGDFFTPDTDFDIDDDSAKTSIYYQHGLDPVLKKRTLGKGTLVKHDDVGIWVEAQLKLRDDYEKAVYGMVQAGKMGWSSGTAAHLVEREPVGKSFHIKRWALGLDASITPTPAEPRTQALSLKSIPVYELKEVIPALEPEAAPEDVNNIGDAVTADNEPIVHIEVMESKTMSEEQTNNAPLGANEIKALQDELARQSADLQRFMKMIEDAPREVVGGYYTVDGGEADSNIKTLGDFMISVARGDEKRLNKVYGTYKGGIDPYKGQTAGSATSGGYYIPEGFLAPIEREINLTSGIAQLTTTIPVGQPSGSIPADDFYTAVTAGSGETVEASGIESNIRAEGGAYQAEEMRVSQIEWRVRDVLSGYVKATREVLNYAPTIEAMLRRKIALALGSKREKFILRGIGGSEPLGILNWTGAVGIAPDTNNVFAVADADEMLSRHLQYASNPVWIIHPSIIPDIASMERGTGAGTFQSNIAQALATTLHGYPIIRSQHLPQANNSGCVILADMGAYALFTYGGMYVDFSEHADFLNGNAVWRFGQEMDGKPLMKSSITLADPQGSFTQSPFVYLND